jgi:DNA topoisomerase-6 subunit B
MARQQREISVSEFFAKNRHLLGFDNKRKALLTAVKEAVDNALDACEEARILPDLDIRVTQTDEDRFRIRVQDNGPGIVKAQIPNIFGKLLYGSKFHRLKMSRGQQGIGISAAGMYGLITTGKPIKIISRTGPRREAHHYEVAIDTHKNHPEIIRDEPAEVDFDHGTIVEIELQGSYAKGRQSVDEYVEQTAIVNPHAAIRYHGPDGRRLECLRGTDELPGETQAIKPHPYGIELGTLMKMLKNTKATQLGAFFKSEFSRVSPSVCKQITQKAGVTPASWVKQIGPREAERLYKAIQETRIMAPPTDCLAPIGPQQLLSGLLKEIKAEFYTASTRPPAVYRGNPFQIEVGLAYGGALGGDKHDDEEPTETNGKSKVKSQPVQTRVVRFANRVPLLYRQSSCCTFQSVVDTNWSAYKLSQARGALPASPMLVAIHMASVWVPFTSESKEAIADYDEIAKEIKLALQECGRRLNTYLNRKKKKSLYAKRRDVFDRYIGELVDAVGSMADIDRTRLREALVEQAKTFTDAADMEFDDQGNPIVPSAADDLNLHDTVIIERDAANGDGVNQTLFGPEPEAKRQARAKRQKIAKKKTRGQATRRKR